eukprot:1154358-Pelagomonas_calceolata.AAC.19
MRTSGHGCDAVALNSFGQSGAAGSRAEAGCEVEQHNPITPSLSMVSVCSEVGNAGCAVSAATSMLSSSRFLRLCLVQSMSKRIAAPSSMGLHSGSLSSAQPSYV